MSIKFDCYQFLGLPSWEKGGSKLTLKEITKAYRSKALLLHPDKRPNDPNAQSNFQKLQFSYDILKDENSRRAFDNSLVNAKLESQSKCNRNKRKADLKTRSDSSSRASKDKEEYEERIAKKLKEEIETLRAMHSKNIWNAPATMYSQFKKGEENKDDFLDKEKILRVSWEGCDDKYSMETLKKIFEEFGKVEDVIIPPPKKTGKSSRIQSHSCLVVMATRDAAVSAMANVHGLVSNPLRILHLGKPAKTASSANHLDEDSILEKMRKA